MTTPPVDWFRDPGLPCVTPITITREGKLFGHLAAWGQAHTSFPGQKITPPRSASDYRWFHTGSLSVQDGDEVRDITVGPITMGCGHASTQLAAGDVSSWYDNTGSIAAYVCAGEDEHGVWVSGAVADDLTPGQRTRLKGCGLSGDWRVMEPGQGLDLVAALSVPHGGFPVPRARVASGAPVALVAAGAVEVEPFGFELPFDLSMVASAVLDQDAARKADGEARSAALDVLNEPDPDRVAALAVLDQPEPDRLAALAALDEGGEFADMAAWISDSADLDDDAFVSTMPAQLRESYLKGKVAARIAWNSPGDWTRCTVQARAHGIPGRMIKGMCSELHRAATGVWPGDKKNR